MASVILTQWRTKLRRQMNERDVVSPSRGLEGRDAASIPWQITRGIHTDCLLNYETVKYFGGEEHEGVRYRDAVEEYQALEYKVISRLNQPHRSVDVDTTYLVSLNLLNLVQNLIIVIMDSPSLLFPLTVCVIVSRAPHWIIDRCFACNEGGFRSRRFCHLYNLSCASMFSSPFCMVSRLTIPV